MSEGFAAVPTWMIRDKSIPRNAILVYASLSSRAGHKAIFPSQTTIAQETGVSERTVRTMLQKLEELGVVERYTRRGSVGQSTTKTHAYSLHPNGRFKLPADFADSSKLPETKRQATGNERQVTPYIEIDKEEIDKSEITQVTRPEIHQLLDLLDSELIKNGVKKLPARNKTNQDAIRLMLDRDGRTYEEIKRAILWCQADNFWRGNILSAAKLREKFETLRAQASRNRWANSTQQNLSVVAQFEAEEEGLVRA